MDKYKIENSQKATVTALWIEEKGYWIIFVHHSENGAETENKTIFMPAVEITGKRFKRQLENVFKKFSCYGITQQQIEEAILKHAKECEIKPPKYLRRNVLKLKSA